MRQARAAWSLRVAGLIGAGMALLAGCAVTPVALTDADRARIASESQDGLFAGQEALTEPITLHQAIARAIKYQAEYRVKLWEEAAAAGQIDVAKFDLLPKATVNAGYSARNNEAFGFGFTPEGTVATNPTASTERRHTTASIGFAWNVLDFGVSYFRARQLADQSLIAEERRRKALQNLAQDVRLAWWRAEAAQRLLPQIDALFDEVGRAIEKTRVIDARKLLPPLQTASLRRSLLDLEQQVAQRRTELAQARIELASLINVPPGAEVKLATSGDPSAATLDLVSDIEALEGLALRNRPELAEETYKGRINESEVKKQLVALFPNPGLDLSRNYDSNRFLLNNYWSSAGITAAFNLTRAFSLPALNRFGDAQRSADDMRRLAMAMAVMTQTRVAAVRFTLLSQEFDIWDEATRDDEQIVKHLGSSADIGVDSELELIRAKARHLVSRVNRDLVYANLEAALGRIYQSVGMDVLPKEVKATGTAELAEALRARIDEWRDANFVPRKPSVRVPVAIAPVEGLSGIARGELRAAVQRVLQVSNVPLTGNPRVAVLHVVAGIKVEPLRDGGRPVLVRVRIVEARTGTARFASEFRTTLSEPIDAEQWRALGEAAAYRLLQPLGRLQSDPQLAQAMISFDLRLVSALAPAARADRAATIPVSSDEDALLVLRLEKGLERPQAEAK